MERKCNDDICGQFKAWVASIIHARTNTYTHIELYTWKNIYSIFNTEMYNINQGLWSHKENNYYLKYIHISNIYD